MHRVRRQLVQLIARSLASPPGAAGGSGRRAQPVSATAPIGARALGCSMRPTTRNQAHDRTTRFAPAGSAGGRRRWALRIGSNFNAMALRVQAPRAGDC
jgi:hypothetical protein